MPNPTHIPDPGPSQPSFLNLTYPLEIEDVPLQVALLTAEVAAIRQQLTRAAWAIEALAQVLHPPAMTF